MKNIVRCFLLLLIAFLGLSAMASSYYASLTTKVSDGCANMGQVYASTSGTESSSSYSPDGNGAVQSSSTSTSGGNVTMYAYAKANEGYEFKGWSTSSSGATSYASTATQYKLSLKASTTKNGTESYTYYAYFAKKALPSFSVTYLAPQNGSYTVDGTPVGSGGLVNGPYTEVYKPRIVATAADGYAFNGWYTTTDGGATKTPLSPEVDYTASFTAATTVGVDFVKSVTVTTADELLYSLTNDTLMEIPAGVTIAIANGTLASGKTLIINGDLFVSGTFTNNGTVKGGGRISTYTKQVTQTGASGDTPFETTCVVASYNKKYYKTTISTLSGKISGTTPTCTIQNAAKVVRNGVTIAQCVWPSEVTPAVLCCTVDPTKAVNHITGFLNPCYDTDAAKGMATMKANGQQTKQMLVLLATKTLNNSACSSAGLLVKIGNYNKLQGNFGTMDLAGSTLTISPSYIDNYTHTLLNGALSVTTLMYSGTLNCINLSSLSLSKLKEDYASVINIYDCKLATKIPTAYNGSTANKNKVNFYSSGDNIYSTSSNFHTQNPTTVYKIYGGRWSAKPAAEYNGAGSDYDFYQTSDSDTSYSLKLKTDQTVVTFDDGSKYESLADAFAALSTLTASSVKMTMVKNATLASAVTIPAGKTVEIELDGCCITASNGFVINNGTFLIGDRRGNIAVDGGRVITSSGNFLVNNGTAEITYGYYTGNVVLNGGELTTHYGRFTGNFSAATGVDKTVVANFRGGYFDKDVSSFLRAGYFRVSGYVGAFPKPAITTSWVSSNGGYWKVNAKLLSAADDAIYKTSSTTKESYTLANWKRRGEIISMVTPYFTYTIDVAVGFDRTTTKDDVYADIAKPSLGANELTDTVQAGGLYRVLSEQLAHPTSSLLSPASQKKYTDALTESTYKEMEFGVYSSKDVDKGTTANLRIDLCTGSSGTNIDNLRSVYALMSEYVVLGAGKDNQAMIQPASGKATFYATIAEAVEACEEGGTVKICNNIDSTDTITISKAVTIDTNGMEFKGTFEPGKTYEMEDKETVLDVEKAIGKKHIAYTFTLKAVPVLPTATQDTTIAIDGCDLAVKYTLGTAAIGYDDWNVDFVVESDKTLSGEEITLKGSNPMEGNQMVAFPGFSLEAGVPVKLLASQGISITYADLIAATEGEYTCGVINNTDKQANVTVKIILSKEDEADIVVEGSVFKGTMAKDYGIVFNDDDTALSITGEGSADVAPTFTKAQKKSVKEAVVRDGVKTIGKRFFKDFTKLSKVTVGKDVTTIGEKAFYKCMSLEKIVIDNPDFDIDQLSNAVVYQLMLDEQGVPYVYPSIEVAGYTEMLEGKVNLTDAEWTKIGKVGTIPMQDTPYRFFRVVLTMESAQGQN